MSGDGLFDDLPESAAPRAAGYGAPRLREPVRDQIELRVVDLDGVIGADHPARVIWAYVERLELSALEAPIKAREHRQGQAPASPRLLLALWLYATSDGVGSARALAGLCQSHDAYRWLCGGVSMNHHGLSDFRTGHPALLERLLTEHVATLSAAGVISLDEVVQDGVVQDGVRVRAAAGSASFRRAKTLGRELTKAKRMVARLKRETHDDPDASNRRIAAARARAAKERQERVAAALEKLGEIEAERERRTKTNKAAVAKQGKPRASTTDPEARVMKMADGGFRPAYNCQVASVANGQIALAVRAETAGSDRGLLRVMIEQLEQHYQRRPKRHLVDGGFNKNDDTEWAAGVGVTVYGPPGKTKHNTDPYAPRRDDGPGVAAWRRRMKSPHGKAVYKRRAPGECINARFRNWGLQQFAVRGRDKATTMLHWFALANNILAGHRLLTAQPA